jgi:uncharacterized protein YlxW (UPF0749 family)
VRSSRWWWRALVPVAAGAAGLLLATSAVTARGTDLRASRTLQVSQLITRQQRTLAELTAEEDGLRQQIAAATALAAVGDRRVRELSAAADRLAAPAGLTPVTGAAVTVALDDVPRAEQQRDLDAGARPDDLVIHQQDVQGVVNALWAGGATAMTIMGERVIATTAVRCVGNTLLLRGRVFSPPFTVTATGDVNRLTRALDADPSVQIFRQYVAVYGLRYRVTTSPRTTLPAYNGPLELTSAVAIND